MMKTQRTAIALSALASASMVVGASSAVEVYEGFQYGNASPLAAANNTGVGWDGGWFGNNALTFGGNSGAQTALETPIAAPSGYALTQTGAVAKNLTSNGNIMHRGLSAANEINLGTGAADNTDVYFSYLLDFGGTNHFFELNNASTQNIIRVMAHNNGRLATSVAEDLSVDPQTGFRFEPGFDVFTAGTEYLVVGKLEINNTDLGAGADRLLISVFDSTETLPTDITSWEFARGFTTNTLAADRVQFGLDFDISDTTSRWDELRIGDSYAAVTGIVNEPPVIPEPASLALVGLGGILLAARRRRA